VRAGQLNRRIRIQEQSLSIDAYGQQIEAWGDYAIVWAHIRPVKSTSAREKVKAFELSPDITHEITVRYNPNFLPSTVTDTRRIIYGQRIYQIAAAYDIEEDRRSIVFECKDTGQLISTITFNFGLEDGDILILENGDYLVLEQ
jgi:SPP1 family predicted phage head-tail adaptor